MKPSSTSKSNRFDLIAPWYDFIGKLVFGNSIIKSQSYFISEIKESHTVLILGGGTGKLLSQTPKCERIHFVDLSQKMIDRAKKRGSKSSINFIQADFLTHDFASRYDVIICPFFLDCFNETHLQQAILKVKNLLKEDGKLIVTDFQQTNGNKFLLKLMHYFFKIFASLESKRLKSIHQEVELVGFSEVESKYFYRNMIFSRLYGNL